MRKRRQQKNKRYVIQKNVIKLKYSKNILYIKVQLEQVARSKFTSLDIIAHNLDRLDLNFRNIFSFKKKKKEVKTIEERRKIIEFEKAKIVEKREKHAKEMLKRRKSEYFLLLKRGVLHIIYMLIYINVFTAQIPSKEVIYKTKYI